MSEILQGLSFRVNLGLEAARARVGGRVPRPEPCCSAEAWEPLGPGSSLCMLPGSPGDTLGRAQLSRLTSWVGVWCFPDAAPTQQATETNEVKQRGARPSTGLWAVGPCARCRSPPSQLGQPRRVQAPLGLVQAAFPEHSGN